MSKLLKQKQNVARALELRMEQDELKKYHVILAGMVVYHPRNCNNGTCEGNFIFTENLTYKAACFELAQDAVSAYECLQKEYLE